LAAFQECILHPQLPFSNNFDSSSPAHLTKNRIDPQNKSDLLRHISSHIDCVSQLKKLDDGGEPKGNSPLAG
jgi:hypothetical protein